MTNRTLKIAAMIAVIVAAVFALDRMTAAPDPAGEGGTVAGQMRDQPDDVHRVRRQLAALQLADRGPLDGYDRDLFPHWSTAEGSCDTREAVLRRDGHNVDTGPDCRPTAGEWTSPYDGQTWTHPSDLDIDHIVPLAHAWVTGAADWTTHQREAFANDLTRPQLLAVTDNVNQSKGDSAPDEWQPPLRSSWCTYATAWIAVKYHYRLTITPAENGALDAMLDHC